MAHTTAISHSTTQIVIFTDCFAVQLEHLVCCVSVCLARRKLVHIGTVWVNFNGQGHVRVQGHGEIDRRKTFLAVRARYEVRQRHGRLKSRPELETVNE